jgi:hypothetical protein
VGGIKKEEKEEERMDPLWKIAATQLLVFALGISLPYAINIAARQILPETPAYILTVIIIAAVLIEIIRYKPKAQH